VRYKVPLHSHFGFSGVWGLWLWAVFVLRDGWEVLFGEIVRWRCVCEGRGVKIIASGGCGFGMGFRLRGCCELFAGNCNDEGQEGDDG
jgi:hypothetical protein